MRLRATSVGIAICGLIAAAPATAATTTIGSSSKPTLVSAYKNVVAWSTYDVASKRFKLTAREGNRVRQLRIKGRGVPFDVDLGPGPRGGVVAVYSRCRRDPDYILPGGSLPQPNYSRGVGCDIYRYDFSSGKESKVSAVSSPAASEYMPAIWKDRIAFARVYQQRKGRARYVTWVYTRSLRKGAHSERAKAGPWGYFDVHGALGLVHGVGGAGVVGIDIDASRLALAWEYWQNTRLPNHPGDPKYEILLDGPGAQQRVVQTLVTPEITNNALFSPSLAGDNLFFGEFNPDRAAASFVARYSIAQPSLSYAPVDGNLVSQSTAGAGTFTVRRAGAFLVTEYGGLTFSPGLPPPSP